MYLRHNRNGKENSTKGNEKQAFDKQNIARDKQPEVDL